MHLEGNFSLNTPKNQVWNFISDPNSFGKCLPQLQALDVRDPTNFNVTVKIGIALIRSSMKFNFTITGDESSYLARYEGAGRGAGVSIKLTITVNLLESAQDHTQISWITDATLGGMLAELPGGLIENTTKKFTKEFFECVKKRLEAPNPS